MMGNVNLNNDAYIINDLPNLDRRLVIVDVGCRWGFADSYINEADSYLLFGFDPDKIECDHLNARYNSPFIKAVPLGLAATKGKKTLYLTKEPACSSLYKPDPYLVSNYPAFHYEEEVGQILVDTTTLDLWANGEKIEHIDHLKIDTQGSELDILRGSVTILKTVRSIQVEVEFNPMYIGQCIFSEVDLFLRKHGFVLWKFSEITHYSKNKEQGPPLDICDVRFDELHTEKYKVYSGQLFWANAHYIKADVLSNEISKEQKIRDTFLFSSLGMPDVLGPCELWDQMTRNKNFQLSEKARSFETQVQQAEVQAQQSETRAQQSETRAQQSETRAQQSETRAQQAEVQAQQSETRAQQAEVQANDWHEQILALHNSTSWKITKPVRVLGRIVRRQSMVGEPSSVSTSQLRQFVRARVVSAIKWAGDRVRRSPGFKRFALRLLRGHPSLQQKLLRVYLENQFKDQPQSAILSGTSTDAVMPQPTPSGINANQRTPLESSFHTYRDQP